MDLYQSIIKHVAFRFDPELTHNAALLAGDVIGCNQFLCEAVRGIYNYTDSGLSAKLGRVTYPSVAGLAAGYDKYGKLIEILPHMSVGHEELGTITPYEKDGNPPKRLFRLPGDYALINRMGLNNYGAIKTVQNLEGREFDIPLDISFDPNMFFIENTEPDTQARDAILSARQNLWKIPYSKKINISCPNTQDGKTYEDPKRLDTLLKKTDYMNKSVAERDIYIKLSHDLAKEELEYIIDVCSSHDVVGFVISNTSNKRNRLRTSKADLEKIGKGGLSGYPLLEKNLGMVDLTRKKTDGKKIIIGVGGIGCNPNSNPALDTYRYLARGAHGVQILTGIPYRGFGIFKEINERLPMYLNGHGNLEDFLKRRG